MYCGRKFNKHAPILEPAYTPRFTALEGWLVVIIIGLVLTVLILIMYP